MPRTGGSKQMRGKTTRPMGTGFRFPKGVKGLYWKSGVSSFAEQLAITGNPKTNKMSTKEKGPGLKTV